MTKECWCCNTEKPLTDFYKCSRARDGRVGKCKQCKSKEAQKEGKRCTDCKVIIDDRSTTGKCNKHKPTLKRHTTEAREKIRQSKIGKKNPNWKGDGVGAGGLHLWVKKRLEKPALCEECNLAPPYDLANISQEYKRELDDWEYLCRKCHMTKDGRLMNLRQFGNPPSSCD